jgi:hypothetical protein
MAPDGVDGNPQNDRIFRLKLRQIRHEARMLARTHRRKIQRIKRQHHFFAAQIRQFNLLLVLIFQLEIRGRLPCLNRHAVAP